jgi:beta-glucosidase/6-phospho-beta-glucosidase/beta-galactosidase
LKKALDDGINIIGYLHWSLIDNYEWAEGFREEGKFGLFYINYNRNNLSRKITRGAEALKLIIEESLLENKQGLISNTALEMAKSKYGSISSDGTSIE